MQQDNYTMFPCFDSAYANIKHVSRYEEIDPEPKIVFRQPNIRPSLTISVLGLYCFTTVCEMPPKSCLCPFLVLISLQLLSFKRKCLNHKL